MFPQIEWNSLKIASTFILIAQVYSYSFVSLVSDVGGTFGLFIGFSFFALWDIFKDWGLAVGHLYQKTQS